MGRVRVVASLPGVGSLICYADMWSMICQNQRLDGDRDQYRTLHATGGEFSGHLHGYLSELELAQYAPSQS
jgi:hypothetical protein